MSSKQSNKEINVKKKYDSIAQWYDLFEFLIESFVFTYWRKKLFKKMKEEKFLEIGVGTGKNIKYYPHNAKAIAVDISEKMLNYAKKRKSKLGVNVNIKNMDVQNLQFEANSFNNIIGTFIFCSVPAPIKGLKEVNRVITDNGRLFLLEHVRPKNYLLGRLFDKLNPIIVKRIGVNINRNTIKNIQNAGFNIEIERNLFLDIFKLIVVRSKKDRE